MFDKIIKWIKSWLIQPNKYRDIRNFSLFRDFSAHDLYLVNSCLHRRELQAGETLFQAGHPVEVIYLIQAGEILLQGFPEATSRHVLKKGQHLGVLDLFTQDQRLSTANAKTDLKVLALPRDEFWELVTKHPPLGVKLLRNCSRFLGSYLLELARQKEE